MVGDVKEVKQAEEVEHDIYESIFPGITKMIED